MKKHNIVDAIKKAAGTENIEGNVCRAKILSVSTADKMARVVKTTDEDDDTRTVYNASLKAVVDGNTEILIIPETDSIVLVAFAENSENQAVIIKCSKIKDIIINTLNTLSVKVNGIDCIRCSSSGTIIGEESDSPPVSAEKMVKGDSLKTWCQNVDQILQTIITWAGTGVAPGPAGGIAPLAGVTASQFSNDILSGKNKVS